MEKPFLTLTTKDFLTGIAPSAFTERGGMFLTSKGVTPVYNPGGTEDTKNGLLQGSVTATDISGSVIVDNILAGCTGVPTGGSNTNLFMIGSSGNIYKLPGSSNTPVNIHTAAKAGACGIELWAPASATSKLLYYWQVDQIGTWDLNTTFDDNGDSYTNLTSSAMHPTRQFVGNIYFGNGSKVGGLTDNGTTTPVFSANLLDLPIQYTITSLSDDGTYLVIAATENSAGYNMFSSNKIFFWDTFSSSWVREFEIRDPFIWAMRKIGNTVYALGQYGIYEVTISGIKKILSRKIGFGTATDLAAGYGANRAISYNGESLMFCTDETVETIGKVSPELPNAHLCALKISSAGTPTFISASLDAGRILVGTDNAKLYSYQLDDTSHEESVSAQTVYFQLPTRMTIKRIDVTFGAPLATGDSFSVTTKVDAVNAAVSFGSATYARDGAVYRKSMYPTKPVRAENLSMYFVFNTGAVKIKKVEIYGNPDTL